jgi:hypothetical protein
MKERPTEVGHLSAKEKYSHYLYSETRFI